MFKQNIRPVLIIILVLSVCSLKTMSQTDSIWTAYKDEFRNNLFQLDKLYCWSDQNFYPGEIQSGSNIDFQAVFKNQNFLLFPELSAKTENFYQFLENLGSVEKEHLIRYFSFHENYFDEVLKSAGLPVEMKYIAPAVSGMNNFKVSENRSAGIWQLTHFQAVLNGLQVTQLVDERFNPWLSTNAFAGVMKQNLAVFKTPELAVLSWLFGNTKVKNAISYAVEEASLNQVIKNLPESADMFIAAFQATAVFLKVNHYKSTNDHLALDTIQIKKQIHFSQISCTLGISIAELEFLNPQYRYAIIPVEGKSVDLVLPLKYSNEFVLLQDSVYTLTDSSLFAFTVPKIEYPPAPGRQYAGEPVKNLQIEGKTKIVYKLRTGDLLGFVAEAYDVEVEDLKYWNNIRNERKIQAGKTLDIFVDDDKVEYYSGLQISRETKVEKTLTSEQLKQSTALSVYRESNHGKKVEHIVKNGESPYTIAKKYPGVTPEDILKWNNIDDERKIQIGQKLILYEKLLQ